MWLVTVCGMCFQSMFTLAASSWKVKERWRTTHNHCKLQNNSPAEWRNFISCHSYDACQKTTQILDCLWCHLAANLCPRNVQLEDWNNVDYFPCHRGKFAWKCSWGQRKDWHWKEVAPSRPQRWKRKLKVFSSNLPLQTLPETSVFWSGEMAYYVS